MDVLRDPQDPRFVLSFEVEDAEGSSAHLNEWGFVVYRDVYSAEECIAARDGMWDVVEQGNPGFMRDDRSTWDSFKSAGKYGLGSRGPVFHPVLVANRQSERLARALSTCLEVSEDDVMVSHDRFTIYRATVLDATVFGDYSRFRTGRRNVHLDLNPWWWLESSRDILVGAESLQYLDAQDFIKENNLVVKSMGRHVQCVLNFADNLEQDGGTLIVPRFHSRLEEWSTEHARLRKPVPFVTFQGKDGEQSEEELLRQAVRIPMRQGSVLVWLQTVMHGTEPNASANTRFAQFVKAFSRSAVFGPNGAAAGSCGSSSGDQGPFAAERLRRRSSALEALLAEAGSANTVTPRGISLFGLDRR